MSPVNGVLSSEMNLWSRILNWTTVGKGGIGPVFVGLEIILSTLCLPCIVGNVDYGLG